jgi:hypothetical protein
MTSRISTGWSVKELVLCTAGDGRAGLRCRLAIILLAILQAGAFFSPVAGADSSTKVAPGWKEAISAPLSASSPLFQIEGKTLRLSNDLSALANHFRRRAPHDYTVNWMKKNVLTERNTRLGLTLLQSNQVQYGGYAAVPFKTAALQWNEDPFSNLNWQWFHHQLMSVHFLLAAAQTNQPTALDTAKDIVRSWAAANFGPTFPSPLSWNDHSTACRLRTLLCLSERVAHEPRTDSEFLGLLLRLIDAHCRVLADENFFKRHTNHGFDQATILFWAASAFPEFAEAREWRALSEARLRDEIAFMFTPEGIHVENSPSYHVWLLAALEDCLTMLGETPRANLEAQLSSGWEYAAFALQPNGRLPLVGDTESRDFSAVRSRRASTGAQNFLYSATRGRAGTKPEAADRVFPLSGYAIFRDEWHDAASFADTTYLFFKCGFHSNYHRHDDDLNVVLSAFGEEWLIDSGLFGYEEDKPIRRYMRSVDAHNTVVIEGASAIRNVAAVPAPGSGITQHGLEPGRSFVTGRSFMYRGLAVERRVEYFKPGKIVIRDQIMTHPAGAYVQTNFTVLFHTAADKRITVTPNHEVLFSSTNGHRLLLRSYPEPRQVTVVAGESKNKQRPGSWVSEAINHVEPSQCVRLDFVSTYSSTCTLTLAPRGSERNQPRGP